MPALESFFSCVYAITNLHIHHFEEEKLIYQIPEIGMNYNPVTAYISVLKFTEVPVSYHVTSEHHYYGIVKSLDTLSYTIIGPIRCSLCGSQNLGNMMDEAHISKMYEKEFIEFLKLIPHFSFNKFMNLLVLFHRVINHSDISTDEIRNTDGVSEIIFSKLIEENLYSDNEVDVEKYYFFEQRIMDIVEKGDVHRINEVKEKHFPPVGKIATTERRQVNNVFIIFTTAAARAAIRGGLDVKTALELSNQYISESDHYLSIKAMETLFFPMILDFTKKVAACKAPENISADIYRCVQYIRKNYRRPIGVADVSMAVGKSRSLISKKFKREIGISIHDYINNSKLENALELLRYTNRPISDISAYLYFSSQSYFQNLFRKKYGITPNRFRQNL